MGAGVQVKVKLATDIPAGVMDAIKADIVVPCVHVLDLPYFQAIEPFDDRKQAADHARFGKVGFELFLRDCVPLLAQFFRVVTDIPCLQVVNAVSVGGKGTDIIQLPDGCRLRTSGQVLDKLHDLVSRLGHLGGQ